MELSCGALFSVRPWSYFPDTDSFRKRIQRPTSSSQCGPTELEIGTIKPRGANSGTAIPGALSYTKQQLTLQIVCKVQQLSITKHVPHHPHTPHPPTSHCRHYTSVSMSLTQSPPFSEALHSEGRREGIQVAVGPLPAPKLKFVNLTLQLHGLGQSPLCTVVWEGR